MLAVRSPAWTLSNSHVIPLLVGRQAFSVLNRPKPNYEGHIPLNLTERTALTLASAFGSLFNPHRGDLIAALGETTATPYFIYRLRDAMLKDPTGRRILRDRPRMNSKNVPVNYLRSLPENTVGRAYADWLEIEGVSPDTRDAVKFIDDKECAYVMQRYRECHDWSHALTGIPTFKEGEVALKAFEFANTVLPMTGLSMVAYTTMKPAEKARFWSTYLPWALRNGLKSKEIINIYWEEQYERDADELRAELGIERPPNLRETRRTLRQQKRAARAAKEAQAPP
ncbi:MAG: Ubiquinone biosynthesis protein [Chrysothrix sp. TS-e1954]|nr:MAG: Ubiquinone biosynthesis protein [Chrysothrix sp. TS-e1954]